MADKHVLHAGFYINLPFAAVVAVPLLLMRIPDQRPKQPALSVLPQLHRHLDLVGFALLAPAIIQLLLALQYGGNQYAWSSSQVIGLFCGAGATFVVWIVWNHRRGENALIPFSVIGRTVIWASGVNYALVMATAVGTTYFLPIYFQAVKDASAIMSGVYLLCIVLPQLLAAVVGGVLGEEIPSLCNRVERRSGSANVKFIVNKVGRVPPLAIVGAALAAIGSGLFSLLSPTTPNGHWVGFGIIIGIGRGMALQMPLVAIQSAVSQDEMSQAMAFAVWCQYIGPTIFSALYNTIFDTGLRQQLSSLVPALDPEVVIAAGATGFRKVVSSEDIPGIVQAFSTSLDHVYYLQAGGSVVAFAAGFGMGWQRLKKSNESAADVPSGQTTALQSETGNEKKAEASATRDET